ncbi:hypothetical protein IWQ60_008045 [Tieghemiomyces parasiticus]|uniref:Uncharacterized protein n=1 Tax=Tieghemiomyces parasiticus TaxID=78921 RepID=A0A9W8DNX4_9FUNG|nr:hypothetical protein IWQ60_008045 [Tieghemiomyces parasiticus]
MESLILSVAIPLASGFVVGRQSRTADNKFWDDLRKPTFTPPKWGFRFVWAILYLCVGWASHLVAVEANHNPDRVFREQAQYALRLYWIQLVVSFAWAPLFFAARQVRVAWASNVLVTILIGMTLEQFSRVSTGAGLLLVPYLAWVVLSGFLNLYIALNN